jgi:dTDP-4-amino-4,6-dideoxygalactose transaminase
MNRASNYKFIIRHESSRNLAEIKESFKQRGVILGGGVYEIPCHLQPVFKAIKIPNSGLATAEKYCPRQICLPITSGLSTQEEKQLQEAIYQVM